MKQHQMASQTLADNIACLLKFLLYLCFSLGTRIIDKLNYTYVCSWRKNKKQNLNLALAKISVWMQCVHSEMFKALPPMCKE